MRRLITAVMLLVSASSQSWASTEVCGTIVGQTWTPAGSPYLVTCDILVAGLTIQPGVCVVFLGNYKFEVGGTLTAVGTALDSICFTRPDSIPGWQGIYFNYSPASSELAYCVIERATFHGIRVDHSSPNIHDCAIRRNTSSTGASSFGAGIYTNSPLTLRHCTINDNAASSTGRVWPSGVRGGGICSSGPLQLFDCLISHNSVSSAYDGIDSPATARGGGLYADSAMVTVERCFVDNNTATTTGHWGAYSYGGGIYSKNKLGACNTRIVSNRTVSGGPSYDPQNHGSGVYVGGGSAVLLNCTIACNSHWGVGSVSNSSVVILNSILFFNNSNGAQIENPPLIPLVNVLYCDVQGGYPGEGNINLHPLFTCADPKIVEGSPCIDAGQDLPRHNDVCFSACADPAYPTCTTPSLGGIRNDMGAGGGPGACPPDEQGVTSVDKAVGSSGIALAVSPNPTRSESRISFVIPQEGDVKVGVWDVQGREVARLLDQRLVPGAYTVKWDGRGRGAEMNPGVYLVGLSIQGRTEVRRLALIR